MTVFDWLDYAIITALFGATFHFGGSRWRWHVTTSMLAVHLLLGRVAIDFIAYHAQAMALIHIGFAVLLLSFSISNYGRIVGLCFLLMLGLDGLGIANIISDEVQPGLHLNYWNAISALQHIQAATLFACFYRHRRSQWNFI